MKYGDTLRQRSIPEWSHYNVDYDVVKRLIKDHTTPGVGKAVSIPGQGNAVEKAFEKKLYAFLLEENERINLFVKSKAGEIERRLAHLDRQILRIEPFDRPGPPSRRPPRRLERYAQIEKEVLQTGQEINSLARFVNAQKIAFRKLLKKYKKWTGSEELASAFTKEVCGVQDSFWNLEVESLFDEYTDVLGVVRAAFQNNNRPDPLSRLRASEFSLSAPGSASAGVASQFCSLVENGDQVGFDGAFASLPISAAGGIVSYWVHPDSLIELQVLLLQHTRLQTPHGTLRTPPFSSGANSPRLKRNSSDVRPDSSGHLGREDDIGVIVLEDTSNFAMKQSRGDNLTSSKTSNTISMYQSYASFGGDARWTLTGDVIVTVGDKLASPSQLPATLKSTRIKRKTLKNFFDTDRPYNARTSSSSSLLGAEALATPKLNPESVGKVRQWLAENKMIKLTSGICARRSRFVGLVNSATRGIWAVLDRDIVMNRNMLNDCTENDWVTAARRESVEFPHAVLQVRYEGSRTDALIRILDRSHLTERVPGFSLEKHSIWECCRPDDKSPPPWLPNLGKDIRKLPEAPKRLVRRQSTNVVFQAEQASSRHTSSASGTDDYGSADTPGLIPSSNTSFIEPSDIPIHNKRRIDRKGRLSNSHLTPPKEAAERGARYWSEYDHPEDPEDAENTYYIYVDPNAPVDFPGEQLAKKIFRVIKRLFKGRSDSRRVDEESALIPEPVSPKAPPRSPSDEIDSDSTSEDESEDEHQFRSYGTIIPERGAVRNVAPRQSVSLITALEDSDRQREQTKFRLYVTSFAASIVILTTLILLAATGRKKLRNEVDAGLIFGICADLIFAFTGVGYMLSRNDRLSWPHRGTVFLVLIAICVLDGMLAASMLV